MKICFALAVCLLIVATFQHNAIASDHLGWTKYPFATLQARQQQGHAELVSTTAVTTDEGFVVISDFGAGGEYIRCFDTFNKSYEPIGERVCWRR